MKISYLFGAVVLTFLFVNVCEAKSVYAITDHGYRPVPPYKVPAKITAYGIDSTDIDWQYTYTFDRSDYPTGMFRGPVGLAMDSTHYIFVTHENNLENSELGRVEGIQIIDAEYMTDLGVLPIEGSPDLAGIVFDSNTGRVYSIERNSNDLYIFNWDPEEDLLVEEEDSPVQLDQINDYGCGLALDEKENILYVTTIDDHDAKENSVYCYDVTDWSWIETIKIEYDDTQYKATTVAVYNDGDGSRFLYTGAYLGNVYLVKTDLNLYETDPNDPGMMIAKNIGANAIGIAVAPDSGLTYVTQSDNKVAVYDTSGWLNDPNDVYAYPADYETDGVSGPAGICVPAEDIGFKKHLIDLTKVDDVGAGDPNDPVCVIPNELFNYSICYEPGDDPNGYFDVVITDYLPPQVSFVEAYPNDGIYDPDYHTYTWYVGYVPPSDPNNPVDPNCFTLTVLVLESAEPLGNIENLVEIDSFGQNASYNTAFEITPVCCWGEENIIYVDQNAAGTNAGTSWQNAYTDLQDALTRAAADCGSEIWVAQGTYSPGNISSNTFTIPDGAKVYGGFYGTETLLKQRDYSQYTTALSGYVNGISDNHKVVTMGSNTILNGFFVEEAAQYGIYSDSNNFTISNCYISENKYHGLRTINSNFVLSWCIINDNNRSGIEAEGTNATFNVENSKIHNNKWNGISCVQSIPTILNSMIHDNGSAGSNYYGIKLYYPSDNPVIRNNTITDNHNEGIHLTGENEPEITNCILWGNDEQDELTQLVNCDATFSCIHNPDDPNGVTPPDPNETGNICTYPEFLDPNNFDYHLDPNSPCIDLGDPEAEYEGEKDIDGQRRVLHGGYDVRVDMGADEFCGGTDTNYADFNDDGYVDLFDYAELANAWLTEPPGMNPIYDLNTDEIVSLVDLSLFTDEWLWMACWNQQTTMMMSQGGGGMEAMPSQSGMSVPPVVEKTPPKVVELTAEQLAELIEDLKKLWEESDEEFRREVGEDSWEEFLKYLYEELERLYRQSETKK